MNKDNLQVLDKLGFGDHKKWRCAPSLCPFASFCSSVGGDGTCQVNGKTVKDSAPCSVTGEEFLVHIERTKFQ